MTADGWSVLAGAVVLTTGGFVFGYPVLLALAASGLVLVLLAGALVVAPPRVRMKRKVTAEQVTVGEPTFGELVVRNLVRWPSPGLVVVDRLGDQLVEVAVPLLKPAGVRTVRYRLPTTRRGRLVLGPLTVERRDPMGLFRRAQAQGSAGVLWVHPRVHQVCLLPVGTVPDFEGRRADTSQPGTTTFRSLREYVAGDDPRRIHWRSTARTGQLMVRESIDTTEPTVTVVLDTRAAVLAPEEFEHAVEIAASIAKCTVDGGRPAQVRITGELPSDAVSLLDRFAAAESTGDASPLRLLEEVDRADGGGALVVVTGSDESAVVAKLAEQRRRFAPVVMIAIGAATTSHRRAGMAVLGAASGVEAAAKWNHFVVGGPA